MIELPKIIHTYKYFEIERYGHNIARSVLMGYKFTQKSSKASEVSGDDVVVLHIYIFHISTVKYFLLISQMITKLLVK